MDENLPHIWPSYIWLVSRGTSPWPRGNTCVTSCVNVVVSRRMRKLNVLDAEKHIMKSVLVNYNICVQPCVNVLLWHKLNVQLEAQQIPY